MDKYQLKHLKSLMRHIDHVRDSCIVLGEKLIELGETELGTKLIANGYVHDASKFRGIEWKYLRQEDEGGEKSEAMNLAIAHHNSTNYHHPEYWGGIENMPEIYLAEFVCDTYSRSNEFGTDYRDWIRDVASKRYSFTLNGRVYKSIKRYMDLLLDRPFKSG